MSDQAHLTSKESTVSMLHEGELRACAVHLKDEGMGYSADVVLRAAEEIDRLTARNAELVKALEEAQIGARRYEIVRRMNVPQFQHLFVLNVEGKGRFDDLVDRAALKGDATP